MPYKDNAALPDNIKNALPDEAQNIWRRAFNAAYDQYEGDEEKCNKMAWGVIKSAGYKKNDKGDWIKENKFTINDIEIFSTGTWKGDTYTEDDLKEIVQNFELLKDEIKPNIHIGHDRGLEHDGQPALGWITKLTIKGKKLLADLSDVPEIVYNAIKKKLYTRVSSEILWGVKHNQSGKQYGKVLTGVALIGASNNIPAVRTLADLSVFTSNGHIRQYDFTVQEGIIKNIGGDKMSEELIKKYKEDLDEANKKISVIASEAKEYKERLEKIQAEQEEDKKNRGIEDIKKYCEDQVKAGKLSPAARDILLSNINQKTYTEKEGFNFSFAQVKEILEKQYTLDMTERTRHDTDKDFDDSGDGINNKVVKYAREKKLTYADAMS